MSNVDIYSILKSNLKPITDKYGTRVCFLVNDFNEIEESPISFDLYSIYYKGDIYLDFVRISYIEMWESADTAKMLQYADDIVTYVKLLQLSNSSKTSHLEKASKTPLIRSILGA